MKHLQTKNSRKYYIKTKSNENTDKLELGINYPQQKKINKLKKIQIKLTVLKLNKEKLKIDAN